MTTLHYPKKPTSAIEIEIGELLEKVAGGDPFAKVRLAQLKGLYPEFWAEEELEEGAVMRQFIRD